MIPCRECSHEVSANALFCPQCGAPQPAKAAWNGWGYEYKSKSTIAGLPLIHIAFKYRPNRTPVIARGVIAIGQFGVGLITIAQFGIGVACLGQIAVGVWAVGQLCAAWSCIAQLGIYVHSAIGMLTIHYSELFEKLLT